MKKVKIGKGYNQSGYGRGFKKSPVVWLINGKAYVKDANACPYETDLEGFVMVNGFKVDGEWQFDACSLISKHQIFKF